MDNDALNTDIRPETPAAAPSPRQELKEELIEFVKMIIWFLLLFGLLRTFVVEGYEVLGDSMDPTVVDRERILVFKLPHLLSRTGLFGGLEAIKAGDIVVLDSSTEPDKRYLKRVIAHGPKPHGRRTVNAGGTAPPGDTVSVRFEKGDVFVNNLRVREDYLPAPPPHEDGRDEVKLGPNQYYVLGDHRSVSKDSRSFGAVEDDHIVGKAIFRFWPLSRIGAL